MEQSKIVTNENRTKFITPSAWNMFLDYLLEEMTKGGYLCNGQSTTVKENNLKTIQKTKGVKNVKVDNAK